LFPSLSYQRATTPSASAIGGAVNGRVQQNQVFAGLGLDGRSPWAGGRYSLDFTSTRVRTSNQFARLNPQYPTAFGASVTQPLFRGRTFDQERRQIEIARRATDLTDAQLAQVVTEQLTLVEEAYWNLVFAARNLEVQAQALAQARGQVTSNERQAQEGTLAPIDVVEAETQVANFRQNVASAQQALTEAENRLKSLMLAGRDAELWNQALVPAEAADRPAPQVSLEEAVAAAMRRRPELRALETARAQNAIDQRFFREQAKPQVDLVGSYTLQGLAGAPLVGVRRAGGQHHGRRDPRAAERAVDPRRPRPARRRRRRPPARPSRTSSRAPTASRSRTSSSAASPPRWCSSRWSCRSATGPRRRTSRAPRSPPSRSRGSASGWSR
jgi:outer membrane protein TolC